MRNEFGGIEQDPNLNFHIIFLEDILDGNKNVFLPVSTQTFVGLKMKVILQTGFQLPESAKATIDHLCIEKPLFYLHCNFPKPSPLVIIHKQ